MRWNIWCLSVYVVICGCIIMPLHLFARLFVVTEAILNCLTKIENAILHSYVHIDVLNVFSLLLHIYEIVDSHFYLQLFQFTISHRFPMFELVSVSINRLEGRLGLPTHEVLSSRISSGVKITNKNSNIKDLTVQ